MIEKTMKVGQRFHWTKLGGDHSSGVAVVRAIRSDEQEGMSSEIEEYVAAWIEAEGESGTYEQQPLTVLLSTDGKSYLDGEEISVEIN